MSCRNGHEIGCESRIIATGEDRGELQERSRGNRSKVDSAEISGKGTSPEALVNEGRAGSGVISAASGKEGELRLSSTLEVSGNEGRLGGAVTAATSGKRDRLWLSRPRKGPVKEGRSGGAIISATPGKRDRIRLSSTLEDPAQTANKQRNRQAPPKGAGILRGASRASATLRDQGPGPTVQELQEQLSRAEDELRCALLSRPERSESSTVLCSVFQMGAEQCVRHV